MRLDAATRIIYHNPAIQAARVMATYASGDLASDLVSWWTLNETSGTRADSHGTNTLADNNSVGYTTGKQGNAADFSSATNKYLSIVDNTSLSVADIDFTLCGWIYKTGGGTAGALATKWDYGNNGREYGLYVESNAMRFRVSSDGTSAGQSTVDSAAISLNTWYFVVAWHDATANTINLQVNNGTPTSTAHTTGVNDGATAFCVGTLLNNGANDTAYNHTGYIDEVGFWKRVLTADERAFLYNSGNGRTYTDL